MYVLAVTTIVNAFEELYEEKSPISGSSKIVYTGIYREQIQKYVNKKHLELRYLHSCLPFELINDAFGSLNGRVVELAEWSVLYIDKSLLQIRLEEYLEFNKLIIF